jgi:hypothetical protein
VVLVGLVGRWIWGLRHAPDYPAAVSTANTNLVLASTNLVMNTSRFKKLEGKWVRPDGGYVLQIRSIDDQGQMDASYFNPRSINVSKAVALRDGGETKVFVELRDVNYPGSTYTLTYDPTNDLLKGIYFQALQGQQFEVFFERLK